MPGKAAAGGSNATEFWCSARAIFPLNLPCSLSIGSSKLCLSCQTRTRLLQQPRLTFMTMLFYGKRNFRKPLISIVAVNFHYEFSFPLFGSLAFWFSSAISSCLSFILDRIAQLDLDEIFAFFSSLIFIQSLISPKNRILSRRKSPLRYRDKSFNIAAVLVRSPHRKSCTLNEEEFANKKIMHCLNRNLYLDTKRIEANPAELRWIKSFSESVRTWSRWIWEERSIAEWTAVAYSENRNLIAIWIKVGYHEE